MSVADELTKLVALRDTGALTQEEFDQQRAILLATPAVVAAASWGPMSQAGPGMACGRCQKPLSPAWRGKCNHCGATYDAFPPRTAATGAPAAAPAGAWAQPAKTGGRSRLGVVSLVVLAILGVFVVGALNRGGAPAATTRSDTTQAPIAKNLVGSFVEWEPVDEANGYAYITIKNNGTATVTAECTVSVSNDFGNFGFDSLVGEEIGPGETFSGRLAISVSKGSFLINKGEVKDC